MAKFEITTPQGQKFEIEAPDAASANDTLTEYMAAQGQQTPPAVQQPAAQPPAPQMVNQAPQPQQEAGWQPPGAIVPIQFPNDQSVNGGMPRLAMPSMLTDILGGLAAPKKAYEGGYDERPVDPETGNLMPFDPRMMDDATSLAGTVAGGSVVPKPVNAAGLAERAALNQADEFGIPLTRGQVAGSNKLLSQEEKLRQFEGPAKPIMQRFDQKQREAIGASVDNQGAAFGEQANMGERVSNALRGKVAASKEHAGVLYDLASNGNLSVKAEALGELPRIVQEKLAANNVTVDERLTPAAKIALEEIQKAGNLDGAISPLSNADRSLVPDPSGGPSFGVALEALERVRKRVGKLQGAPGSDDARALGAIRSSLDEWIDQSVDTALFTGDDEALDILKQARAESRNYLDITRPKPGDAAGARIQQMQENNVTAREVSNWLYGADIVSPSLEAPRVAGKLKMILGPGSEEFGAVRASAWERLTKDLATGDVRSAQMVAKRIEEFTNGKGRDLAKVLFTDAQLARMRMFSGVLKKTVTPKDATNPSRSAFMLGPMMNGVTNSILGAAGLSIAGVPGLAAAAALPVFKNVKAIAGAAKAVRPGQVMERSAKFAPRVGNTLSIQNAPKDDPTLRLEA